MLAPDARGVFDPPTEYDISRERMRLKEFHDYADEYIVRPPYQRTTVWGRQKKLRLLDSLFRRYYVPHIVLRNIRLTADHTIREVIDGQQRITVAQAFYRNELPLPKTLEDVSASLPGQLYKDLPPNVRRFVDSLKYDVDIVKGHWRPEGCTAPECGAPNLRTFTGRRRLDLHGARQRTAVELASQLCSQVR